MHSTVLDEKHLWAATVYVEQNPVRAGMVEGAGQWPWSGARSHLGLAEATFSDLTKWARRFDPPRWKRVLDPGC